MTYPLCSTEDICGIFNELIRWNTNCDCIRCRGGEPHHEGSAGRLLHPIPAGLLHHSAAELEPLASGAGEDVGIHQTFISFF